MNTKAKTVIAVAATATLALAASSCGSGSPTACVVVDASKSTRYALGDYITRFRQSLDEVAKDGGSMAAVVVTGDPKVEAKVERSEDFDGLSALDQASQRAGDVEDFADRIDRHARLASGGATNPAPGSGVVAAIDLIAAQDCASIEVLSDGLEASDVHMLQEDIISAAGRARLLDRLNQRGLLPDLSGLQLHFPLGGYLPQGTNIEKVRVDAVPRFWEDYAARTDASLSWRR